MKDEKKQLTLSKSAFIRSLQCLKSLYLYKNKYNLRDRPSPELLARFQQGVDIGKLAWELFPGGVDVHPASFFSSGLAKATQRTSEHLFFGDAILYEASFMYNRALAILDILVANEGKIYAYEVKSSVLISETYMMDAAFQYYVMKGAGYQPEQFSIIHLKEGYDSTSRDVECLRVTDVTRNLIALQDYIEKNVSEALKAITDDSLLHIQPGEHCSKPYLCDFSGYCTRELF